MLHVLFSSQSRRVFKFYAQPPFYFHDLAPHFEHHFFSLIRYGLQASESAILLRQAI